MSWLNDGGAKSRGTILGLTVPVFLEGFLEEEAPARGQGDQVSQGVGAGPLCLTPPETGLPWSHFEYLPGPRWPR